MARSRTCLLLLAAFALIGFAVHFSAPAPVEAFPPQDFILCTCELCKAEPETICQISPTGYSIVCADWYRLHC